PQRNKIRCSDRLTLSAECLEILSGWRHQVSEKLKGGTVTRTLLVEWLIKSKGDRLKQSDISVLIGLCSDPVKSLEWVLMKARVAQKNGENVNVSDLIDQVALKRRRGSRKDANRFSGQDHLRK